MLKKEERQRIEAYVVNELNYKCPNDMIYFIKTYIQIENPDAEDLFIPFNLWTAQIEALLDFENFRLIICNKSRQVGLTWVVIAYSVYKALFTKGYKVLIVSASEKHGFKVIERVVSMLNKLPPWMIRKAGKDAPDMLTWDNTKSAVTITHPTGQISSIEAVPCSPNAARSFSVNLLIFDEWAAHADADKVWSGAYPTINRPTGGKFIGISTMELGTLFHEEWDKAYAGDGMHPIFIPWHADPNRTPEWYEQTKRDNPTSYMREYPATPEESTSMGEFVAFPEFNKEIHVCKTSEPPAHWRKWMAVDNGYSDPFWFGWFAVNEDGIVYLYREYTRSHKEPALTREEQAVNVVDMSRRPDGTFENIDYAVLGVDAWNTNERDQAGRKMLDYYIQGGFGSRFGLPVGFVQAVRDRRARKAVIHEFLRPYEGEDKRPTAKLQIMDCCVNVIRHLPLLTKDERDPEKVGDSKIDHDFDGLSYGLLSYYGATKKKSDETETFRDKKRALAKARKRSNRLSGLIQ